MFLLLDDLFTVIPNDQLPMIIGNNQALSDKIDAGVDDGLLVLVAHDVDQLPAHHLPLFNVLYPAAEELVMAVRPETQTLYLPCLFMRVCDDSHYLFILYVDHDQLTDQLGG